MAIAVVGANSFIARALRQRPEAAAWRFVGHREALETEAWLHDIHIVLNCAFDDRLKERAYDAALDVDVRLAEKIQRHHAIRYVMLSSRLTYGPAPLGGRLTEALSCNPIVPYAKAKIIAETKLVAMLGERLTVVRLSNVFGAEYMPGRKNFISVATRTLIEDGRIVLDINPFVERDFVPVTDVARSLSLILQAPKPGVFNLGAGHGTPVGLIAVWLIKGYGQGQLVVTDVRDYDSFWLDISAAQEAFGIETVSAERIEAFCIDLGGSLRQSTVGESLQCA